MQILLIYYKYVFPAEQKEKMLKDQWSLIFSNTVFMTQNTSMPLLLKVTHFPKSQAPFNVPHAIGIA